ncbi:MAG: geranylgeranylglyceryl/heptaprenylglyceryl phosphate synthase [Thermoplasmataceae archaeon]
MRILEMIRRSVQKNPVHMTLIDPAAQSPERSARIAAEADTAGTDFFMIGGSTNIDEETMDAAILSIKKVTKKPLIIFPGSSNMVSRYADAIYFLSLLNSRNPEFIVGHQARAAPALRKLGIETISMGYIVFEPGMTVGRTGQANLIASGDHLSAVSFAMAAEMFGMSLVYLEAGSGSPVTVDPIAISEVKKHVKIPVVVGGGIRSASAASSIVAAGADVVVTGTVAERSTSVEEALSPIIRAVHEGNRQLGQSFGKQ